MGHFVCPNDYPAGCTCRDPYCKSQRKSKRGGGQVTGAVLAAGMGALTLGQAYNEPTQTSLNTFGNYADTKAENTGANRARGQRRETTGNRSKHELMNKAIRIIVSILLITGGIAVLGFAAPLLQNPNAASIVGFLILAALSTAVAISGFRIACGERMRDVFSDLFRGIGR